MKKLRDEERLLHSYYIQNARRCTTDDWRHWLMADGWMNGPWIDTNIEHSFRGRTVRKSFFGPEGKILLHLCQRLTSFLDLVSLSHFTLSPALSRVVLAHMNILNTYIICTACDLLRKQPARPITEISVWLGYLPGKCLFVQGIGVFWKTICVRGLV